MRPEVVQVLEFTLHLTRPALLETRLEFSKPHTDQISLHLVS
jgi:hypothetical protein